MDEMAASLAEVVAADRKFLSGERRARLENLRAVLADPTLTDGQKMDVLLDAWQVEASYGLTVGADRGVNDSGALAVFLRIGRLLHAGSPRTGAELASRPRTAGASSPKRMPPCSPKP